MFLVFIILACIFAVIAVIMLITGLNEKDLDSKITTLLLAALLFTLTQAALTSSKAELLEQRIEVLERKLK